MNGKTYREMLRNATYVMNMMPVLNVDALFSDMTADFVTPMEPDAHDTVTIRMRTAAANVDEVFLVFDGKKQRMEHERTDGIFDYYRTSLQMPDRTLEYYFEVISGNVSACLLRFGISDVPDQHSFFRISPGFHTPDWAKGAVMYQIYTDRFCNGDPDNDPLTDEYSYIHSHIRHVDDWDRLPESMDVGNFYGGDLEGVREKLDYLQSLGVEVLYFNPLFVSPSNHKYDTQDYEHIDPHFTGFALDHGALLEAGQDDNREAARYICRTTSKENLEKADAYFADFISEIHKRGMRIILDGVFNHCGSFNHWLDREGIYEKTGLWEEGAYVSADSPYHSYFHFKDPDKWPYNASYEGWWNHDTLPKLNYDESPELVEKVLHIAGKWVSPPYNADGWRLDVAADLGHSAEFNHKFWRLFRQTVRAANPDALILAEHYGSAREWLLGDQWDSIMNYDAFMEPVSWFFTGMEKHSDEYLPDQVGNSDSFFGSMRFHMSNFLEPSLLTAMNELSNHDHSRFLTRTNHKVGRVGNFDYDAASEGVNYAIMREAVLCQMTWPGAPTLYYGDEAGVCGFTDPDNRRTYPWGHENQDMIAYMRDVVRLRSVCPVLRTGSIKFLHGEKNVIAYARFDERETVIAVFSIGQEKTHLSLPVWTVNTGMDGYVTRVFLTDEQGYSTATATSLVIRGRLDVVMEPESAQIFVFRKADEKGLSKSLFQNFEEKAGGINERETRTYERTDS